MNHKWIVPIILLIGAGLSGMAVETFQPDKFLVYKTTGDTELKLHVFEPEGHQSSDSRPAIIFFFGGGWKQGSPDQFYPHCDYLASRGMVAMAAEYRVESVHGTSPIECVKDGKSAMRWVRSHADDMGIDPNRIAAGGGSAGGHVAAATATLKDFNEEGEDTSISCRPNALVLFNPVIDSSEKGYGFDRVKDYWRAFSPLHNLNAGMPPTIVFLGTKDRLIPVETAQDFKSRMRVMGIRSELYLYDGQEHGFFNYRNPEYYQKTVVEMDRFLRSLGFLKGSPGKILPGQ